MDNKNPVKLICDCGKTIVLKQVPRVEQLPNTGEVWKTYCSCGRNWFLEDSLKEPDEEKCYVALLT
jgi:hypothetical protein